MSNKQELDDLRLRLERSVSYKSTKVVKAITLSRDKAYELGLLQRKVGADEVEVINPFGYAVMYADGYISWSPVDAFVDGYTATTDDDKLYNSTFTVSDPSKAKFLNELMNTVRGNNNKIPSSFIDDVADRVITYEYSKTGNSARHAVGTIPQLGAKFVGNALVLDPKNDVEEIGNKVARDNIKDQLWSYLGGLVKAIS